MQSAACYQTNHLSLYLALPPRLCKNYVEKKIAAGICFVMAWLAQSPDQNPIKHSRPVGSAAEGLGRNHTLIFAQTVECYTFVRHLLLQRVYFLMTVKLTYKFYLTINVFSAMLKIEFLFIFRVI